MKSLARCALALTLMSARPVHPEVGWETQAGLKKVNLILTGDDFEKEGLAAGEPRRLALAGLDRCGVKVAAPAPGRRPAREIPVLRLDSRRNASPETRFFSDQIVLRLSLHQSAVLARNGAAFPLATTWWAAGEVFIIQESQRAKLKALTDMVDDPPEAVRKGIAEVVAAFCADFSRANPTEPQN